ncbi:hypothetical protein L7F22_014043 [Adiantum nelumboides]|nr:hypothetical protein [Adiantum nelumboides]
MKEEADMGADDREGGLGRRVCRRKKKAVHEPDFVYQKRGKRVSRSLKKKGRHAHELFRNSRLVKIELDAAQALADFSRLAHLPVQQCPSDLKWFVRRKRTIRSVELQCAHIMSKTCGQSSDLRTSELESTTSLSHGDKASPIFDCRAESPSSPLPSSKLACKAFFVNGSKLSIRRDASAEVMQKSIKTEMKELEPVASSVVKQKSSVLKPQMPLCLVKMEPLGEISSSKGEGLQHSKVQPLCNLASQLVELSRKMDLVVVDKGKQKTTLSEDDKEARRLRRIQANRESARQTIRKKQLLCEELKRQLASLASENDAMKQKRDMFMQELALLRGQNYHLKVQLDLRASNYLGSQEPLPQLASLPLWQAPEANDLNLQEGPSKDFSLQYWVYQKMVVNVIDHFCFHGSNLLIGNLINKVLLTMGICCKCKCGYMQVLDPLLFDFTIDESHLPLICNVFLECYAIILLPVHVLLRI